ncbi:MAG: hypothetical protein J5733_12345 [Bacteroidaceae bacterium]|nr:hypothetical protein [Bacteroidaceae bacterium]
MKKLDLIKNVLDNEVLDYLESETPDDTHIEVETNICFEEDVEYDALVRIEASFNYIPDYITDDYGNRHDESRYELKNYHFEIIDLYDFENERYLIQGGKVSKELEEA